MNVWEKNYERERTKLGSRTAHPHDCMIPHPVHVWYGGTETRVDDLGEAVSLLVYVLRACGKVGGRAISDGCGATGAPSEGKR